MFSLAAAMGFRLFFVFLDKSHLQALYRRTESARGGGWNPSKRMTATDTGRFLHEGSKMGILGGKEGGHA